MNSWHQCAFNEMHSLYFLNKSEFTFHTIKWEVTEKYNLGFVGTLFTTLFLWGHEKKIKMEFFFFKKTRRFFSQYPTLIFPIEKKSVPEYRNKKIWRTNFYRKNLYFFSKLYKKSLYFFLNFIDFFGIKLVIRACLFNEKIRRPLRSIFFLEIIEISPQTSEIGFFKRKKSSDVDEWVFP